MKTDPDAPIIIGKRMNIRLSEPVIVRSAKARRVENVVDYLGLIGVLGSVLVLPALMVRWPVIFFVMGASAAAWVLAQIWMAYRFYDASEG